MGGAVSVLSRGRALALAGTLVALVAYTAAAEQLPALPSRLDVAFTSAVVLPAFAAVIWLGLPLARLPSMRLLLAAVAAGTAAVGLTLLDADAPASVAKLACYALAGLWFLTLFDEAWWVTTVALVVPWVDIWSVAAGPTRHVLDERPGLFSQVAVALPSLGADAGVLVGPPDVLFFALFLAAADRFALRVRATWLAMTALLALTFVLVWTWDAVQGLPALPAVCFGFLLANGDLLWRGAREAWLARREPPATE